MRSMKLYKQTTEYTCAVSSLLMILNHFDSAVELSKDMEFEIWRETVNLPTRAPSIYGLAYFATNHDKYPDVIVEEREYNYPDYRFKGYKKKEIDEAKYMSKLHAKRLTASGIDVEERPISVDEVITALDEEHVLLLRVNAGIFRDTGSTSKYLAFIKEDDSYSVYDPKAGIIESDRSMLKESLETLKTKKKRDKRMLVF